MFSMTGVWRRLPKRIYSNKKICKNQFSSQVSVDEKRDEIAFTTKLKLLTPDEQASIETFSIMDQHGNLLDEFYVNKFDRSLVTKMYCKMTEVSEIDKILYECQRQGRISFYMTSHGEEGTQVGSAAAVQDNDLVYAQYREMGVLLWRGFTIDQIMNQCFGNCEDLGKGKQMPVHFGSPSQHFVTISSPLTTQLPQAVGSAYSYKLAGNNLCVLVYFGEGAASEGDAHAAMNFASTLRCPVVFICRNNGYAISTPISEQFAGDGIASRAFGYGMAAIRVDGNDPLAMYEATKLARDYAVANNKPVLLEAMTYRRGHHSTSDDSTAYRSINEIEHWQKNNDPISRLATYMENQKWWSHDEDIALKSSLRKQVMSSLLSAEALKKPNWKEMFEDVYYKMPDHLMEQMKYMEDHLSKYGKHYKLDEHKDS